MSLQGIACPGCQNWFRPEGRRPRCPVCGKRVDAAQSAAPSPAPRVGPYARNSPANAAIEIDGVREGALHLGDAAAAMGFLAVGVLLLWWGVSVQSLIVVFIAAGLLLIVAVSAWASSFWRYYAGLTGPLRELVRLPRRVVRGVSTVLLVLGFVGAAFAQCSGG